MATIQTSTEVADRQKLLDAFEMAIGVYGLCPNRVWAVAKDDLPKLLPSCKPDFRMPSSSTADAGADNGNDHNSCTFDFCEQSQRDFTAVQQRHECPNESCKPLTARFSRHVLDDAVIKGLSTVWALDGVAMLQAPRPYMAISHVWSDGTGIGAWKAGQVNECLYHFFRSLAERFGCEGIWWDTICIPEAKKARQKAIHMIQNNYQRATITLIHDCFLRNWKWDPETACCGILMSPWFSRGWTALELAKSRKVKVIFKGEHGLVVKDLDQDILAKPNEPATPARVLASSILGHLRGEIKDLNGLLVALGSRSTSWPKDRAIISALLLDIESEKRQQDTYQKILMEIRNVAPGNLFHNSATMSRRFQWCPSSLWSMPLDSKTSSLQILDDQDLLGIWRISCVDFTLEERCSWRGTHRLIEERVRYALQTRKDCYLLAEVHQNTTIERALLATPIGQALDGVQRYELVGAVYPHPPLNGNKWEKLEVRLAGDVSINSKLGRTGNVKSLRQSAKTLHQAVLTGDEDAFNILIASPEQNLPDELGQLPIHIAAERGHEEMVKCLAALPNSKGRCRRGQTAMHRAAWGGSVDVVKQLLGHEFAISPKDYKGDTPQHIAAELGNEAVLELLVTETKAQDESNTSNQSPLHYAAMSGELNSAQLLVDANANKHSRDRFGWTPLHFAAAGGNLDVIRLLLDDELDGAQDYVNCEDMELGWRPIHFAAMSGSTDAVDLLLESGADANVKDVKGWTPRHFAEMNQHEMALSRFTDQGAKLARICQDADNITPLHCLAVNMRQGSAGALVKRAAEVASEGNSGNEWSPFIFAIEQGLDVAFARLLCCAEQDAKAIRVLMDAAIRKGQITALQHLILTQHNQDPQALLLLAVECGCASAVELLLDIGGASAVVDPKPLHLAAQRGDDTIASILLSKGAYCDGIVDERSPLSVAAEAGHAALVELLLAKGGNIELAYKSKRTPLSYAAERGELATVKVLLEWKANVEGCFPIKTPLSHAAEHGHDKVVQLLLANGAKIETSPPSKRDERPPGLEIGTPLALAARGGHITIMQMLVEKRARVTGYATTELIYRQNYGIPLCLASERGQVRAVELLLREKAKEHLPYEVRINDPEAVYRYINSHPFPPPLNRAIANGNIILVKLLLKEGAVIDDRHAAESAIGVAVRHSRYDITKLLLDQGASVDGKRAFPNPLNIDMPPLLHICSGRNDYKITELLISRGASVNMTDDAGRDTALSIACNSANKEIVQLLLDNNATVERGCSSERPFAVAVRRGAYNIVELLLKHKTNVNEVFVNHVDPGQTTALHIACCRLDDHMFKLLLTHGADADAPPNILQAAVSRNNVAIVDMLLGHGKDINGTDQAGETPLFWAADTACPQMRMFTFLLGRGANVHAGQERSGGPLFPAISRRHYKFVELLLQEGADFNKPGPDGLTAVQHALSTRSSAICRLLQRYGADIDDAVLSTMPNDVDGKLWQPKRQVGPQE
ncbi:hypothetical protein MY11210_008141 [Beauveria gryllotalpidicola]